MSGPAVPKIWTDQCQLHVQIYSRTSNMVSTRRGGRVFPPHALQDARRILAGLPGDELVSPQSFSEVYCARHRNSSDYERIYNSVIRAQQVSHLRNSADLDSALIRCKIGSVDVHPYLAEHSAARDFPVTQSKGTNHI
jgi:hypothetical protein